MCESTATIIAGVIGFFGALIGAAATIIAVRLTITSNSKQQKQDLINQAKPILINYNDELIKIDDYRTLPQVYLYLNGNESDDAICGTYKNTNNGILFLDYVKTKSNVYYPKLSSVIDRNTVFQIYVMLVKGEKLDFWEIYCHDIYGNNYKYVAKINTKYDNRLELVNSEPISIKMEKDNER